MQSLLSKKTDVRLKVFGWYQIVGGIIGLLVTIWLLVHMEQLSGLLLILFLLAFGLYGFSVYCGRLLITENYQKGLKLSVFNQALQILHFKMLGWGYLYISGAMFETGVALNQGFKVNFNFMLTSSWSLSVGSDDRSFILAINLVAIYWLYFIERLQKNISDEINYMDTEPEIIENKDVEVSNANITKEAI